MVQHSPTDQFKFGSFILIIIVGLIVINLTYLIDRQKQITRATNGNYKIWGKQAKIIKYANQLLI